MNDRELRTYLRETLGRGENVRLGKKEETVAGCTELMRRQGAYEKEERTGFWRFLSDVFRFEGLSICGLQAGVLFFVCMWLGAINDVLGYVSMFTPLFAFSAVPALFRSRFYKMGELEAATRASGVEMLLARLVLAGAANLVCITALLCLGMRLQNSGENMGRMILYGLVPYLVSMAAILWFLRRQGRERPAAGAVVTVSGWMVWCALARMFPWLYETSATGLWIVLFVTFAGFFGREISFMLEMRKGGKNYGIIG